MSGTPAKIVCQVSGAARLPTGWPVSGQLLIHSSVCTTTNTRATQGPSRAKWDKKNGKKNTKKKPGSQFLHCRYGNRAVSIGTEERLTTFFSISLLYAFSIISPLIPPGFFFPGSSSRSHLLFWNKSIAV
ncbi:hypothetical protein KUCAC02_036079 [Chaenocephalus aceratus]|nr:hypothetical protein KUCAC02_036079 [Chaenocephalus aceratus]